MKRAAQAIILAATAITVVCSVAAGNMVSEEHAGLLHVLQTDAYEYVLSDSVEIEYTVTNVTAETMYIYLPVVNWPLWLRVYDPGSVCIWVEPDAYFPIDGWATVAPGDFLGLQATWDMYNHETGSYVTETGVYTVEGELFASDPGIHFTIQLEIEIVEPGTGLPWDDPVTWGTLKAMYR